MKWASDVPSGLPEAHTGIQEPASRRGGGRLAPLVPTGGEAAPVLVLGSEKLPGSQFSCCRPFTVLWPPGPVVATRTLGPTRLRPCPLPAPQTFVAFSEHPERPRCRQPSFPDLQGPSSASAYPRRVPGRHEESLWSPCPLSSTWHRAVAH